MKPYIIGLIFIFVGVLLSLLPPKKINDIYGYRTSKSMKNELNWKIGNRLAARCFLLSGLILVCIGHLTKNIDPNSMTIILMITLFILIIISFLYIESKLSE